MAADMFLKVEGADGESEDKAQKNWIEVLSWSWGESQTGSAGKGGGSGVGKVDMQDFAFTKYLDKSSPKLMFFCASGKHIPKVEFLARKAGGEQQKYMTVKFEDVLVSSYNTSNSSGSGSLPVESITLNFSKIEMEYFQQDSKGKTASAGKVHWDLRQNVGGN